MRAQCMVVGIERSMPSGAFFGQSPAPAAAPLVRWPSPARMPRHGTRAREKQVWPSYGQEGMPNQAPDRLEGLPLAHQQLKAHDNEYIMHTEVAECRRADTYGAAYARQS
jgi:hypothetical protein